MSEFDEAMKRIAKDQASGKFKLKNFLKQKQTASEEEPKEPELPEIDPEKATKILWAITKKNGQEKVNKTGLFSGVEEKPQEDNGKVKTVTGLAMMDIANQANGLKEQKPAKPKKVRKIRKKSKPTPSPTAAKPKRIRKKVRRKVKARIKTKKIEKPDPNAAIILNLDEIKRIDKLENGNTLDAIAWPKPFDRYKGLNRGDACVGFEGQYAISILEKLDNIYSRWNHPFFLEHASGYVKNGENNERESIEKFWIGIMAAYVGFCRARAKAVEKAKKPEDGMKIKRQYVFIKSTKRKLKQAEKLVYEAAREAFKRRNIYTKDKDLEKLLAKDGDITKACEATIEELADLFEYHFSRIGENGNKAKLAKFQRIITDEKMQRLLVRLETNADLPKYASNIPEYETSV